MKKQCSKCKEFKDLSMFSKSKGAKDNLYPCCKSCSNIINKSYRINNIDKIKERERSFHKSNKEKQNKIAKDYYHRNKEVMQKQSMEYHKKNHNAILKSNRTKGRLKVINLDDRYIKQLICNTSNLTHRDIPQEVVEAKRQLNEVKNSLTRASGLKGIFEGTKPLKSQGGGQANKYGALRDKDPNDSGVNIENESCRHIRRII